MAAQSGRHARLSRSPQAEPVLPTQSVVTHMVVGTFPAIRCPLYFNGIAAVLFLSGLRVKCFSCYKLLLLSHYRKHGFSRQIHTTFLSLIIRFIAMMRRMVSAAMVVQLCISAMTLFMTISPSTLHYKLLPARFV